MAEFGIDVGETTDLGRRIATEGNNFEEQIHHIETTVDNCGASWTNGGFETFRAQTRAAASELNVLRDFFKRYGDDVVGFAGESQEAIDRVNSIIASKF